MILPQEKVCVMGLWHLGVVTSVCLADLGCQVVGVDKDVGRVEALNSGRPPIYEPGLDGLVSENLTSGKLRFTTDLREAALGAKYILVAYDTPVDENDEVDLSGVFATVEELAAHVDDGATIIISSQVPVGTCAQLIEKIRRAKPTLIFSVACVPENLRLGQAIERFKHPEFLVIGADDPAVHERVEQLLSVIDAPKVKTDLLTAEMTKHAINAYLATAISFGNEIANLCDEVGADALKVVQALRLDSRVSPKAPLNPGLGFAGGTLARDMKVLCGVGREKGYAAPLLNGVLQVNEGQNGRVVARLKRVYPSLRGRVIGVLGLTYKAGTSTLRRSAAVEIIRSLTAEGATVRAYDPKVDPAELQPHLDSFTFCSDPYAAATGSDALILVTEWPEFKELDFQRIRSLLRNPILLDTQNMLDADRLSQMGFVYQGVGRGRQPQEEITSR